MCIGASERLVAMERDELAVDVQLYFCING